MAGLKKEVAVMSVGLAVQAATNWLTFSLLAKIATKDEVGLYSLAIAAAVPINALAQLQLRNVLATDTRTVVPFGDYAGTRVVAMLASIVAGLGFAVAMQYSGMASASIALLALAMGFDQMGDIYNGLHQRGRRFVQMAWSLSLRGVAKLLLTIFCYRLTNSIPLALAGMALASALIFVAYDYPSLRKQRDALNIDRLSPAFHWPAIKGMVWLTLPLAIAVLLQNVNVMVGRYAVERMMGKESLATFSALAYVVLIARTAVISVGVSIAGRLADTLKKREVGGFQRLYRKALMLALALGLVSTVIGYVGCTPILTLLYGEKYTVEPVLFALVLLGGGIGYLSIIQGVAITALRYLRAQVPWFGFSVVVTLGLTVLLVPSQGLMGAAWAALAGATAQAVWGFLLVQRALGHFDRTGELGKESAATAPAS